MNDGARLRIIRPGENRLATSPAELAAHRRRESRPYIALLGILAAWGVFSFGAVYPWGWQPLLVGSAIAGLAGIFTARHDSRPPWSLIGALALLNAAVLVQVLTLPRGVLLTLSPAAGPLLREYTIGFALDERMAHALSINPQKTWIALGCLAAFTILFLGAAMRLGRRDVSRLCAAFVVLGVAVALEGLVQRIASPLEIYGFWAPTGENPAYFGPFVNRNHFAGWMLMTLPLSLGYFAHTAQQSLARVSPKWRHWLAWLSSPAASAVIMIGFAASTMALALFLTMSRSGVASLTIALVIATVALLMSRASRRAGMLAGLAVAALLTVTMMTIGSDLVLGRFDTAEGGGLQGRLGAWKDALTVAYDFPLTGTGLNTFGVAMLRYQSHSLHKWYSTAHNDYLQLLSEGGALLVLPALLVVVTFILEVRRRFLHDDPGTFWIRIGALTGLAAIGVQEWVEFSLQIPGNAVMFALVSAIAIHRAPIFRDSVCDRR